MKKMFVTGMLALAMIIVTSAATVAQVRGIGRLNGVVVSEAGDPIVGVIVKAPLDGGNALEGNSNDQGRWALGGIGKGEWIVEFVKPGFESKRMRVVVQKESLNPEQIKVVMKSAS